MNADNYRDAAGWVFHTFTKSFKNPFDEAFMDVLVNVVELYMKVFILIGRVIGL
jgi:hypothetical protein